MAVSEYTHTIADCEKLHPIVFVVIEKFSLVEMGIWLLSRSSIYMGYLQNVRLRGVGQVRFLCVFMGRAEIFYRSYLNQKSSVNYDFVIKEWTMSSMRASNAECTLIVGRARNFED